MISCYKAVTEQGHLKVVCSLFLAHWNPAKIIINSLIDLELFYYDYIFNTITVIYSTTV